MTLHMIIYLAEIKVEDGHYTDEMLFVNALKRNKLNCIHFHNLGQQQKWIS